MIKAGAAAIVIGGTGGIGSQIVADLTARKMRVAVVSRNCSAEGVCSSVLYEPCDVTDIARFQMTLGRIIETLGPPSILVHSAGRRFPGGVCETELADWHAGLNLLLTSAFVACKFVLPAMANAGGGSALLISSAAGNRAVEDAITYATAKAALFQMTRCMAREFAHHYVRVNCLAPGFVETEFHRTCDRQTLENAANHRIPLGRFAHPSEISQMALTMLENDYLTGETIILDGGLNIGGRA